MSDVINRGLALAIALAPLLVACGGGNASDPAAINAPQCSGSSCPVQGQPPQGTVASLCPATADIVNSTFLGGAGSGEVVSLNINATAMTYSLTWLESPIPAQAVAVQPTRQGVTITGNVSHPPTGVLPTAEQIRCAFVLQPGSGALPVTTAFPAGGTYSTAPNFNAQNPPMIFVGMGVAGGGIPGAEISFAGEQNPFELPSPPAPTDIIFPVPDRKFDFYPFIGFANTDSNLADLQGTYNALAYHIRPTDAYATIGANAVETFDASGNCTSSTTCITTSSGQSWAPVPSGGYFTSADAPQLLPSPVLVIPGLGSLPFLPDSPAYMVLGRVNGALIPVVVRAGIADPTNAEVDDESGIAMLAPATTVTSGMIDGGYVGADSNFKYTATLIAGASGTFVNPSTQAPTDTFGLQYGASTPGLVTAADTKEGTSGFVISAGGLYAVLLQGTTGNETENGGVTPSSAIAGQTSSMPYFGIGALVNP
jgi:hypothetical protein